MPLVPARRPSPFAPRGRATPATLPAVLTTPAHPFPAARRLREERPDDAGRPPLARRWVFGLAAAVVVGHVAANLVSPYGVHRDELLYLAMGEHLRLWAMDFPPFIALLAQLTRLFAGQAALVEGTAVLRLAPAVTHGLLVVLAALLARELGGRRGAQLLAGLAVAASPLFLRAGSLFQPVVFDQLWWTLGFLALVRLGRTPVPSRPYAPSRRTRPGPSGPRARRRMAEWWARDLSARWRHDPRLGAWTLLGAAVGFGLLTKFSIAFFAAGALVAVLATPSLRRQLRTGAPWAAALLAAVLGAPSVVGQVRLGWPVAAQMADLRAEQLARVGPLDFAAGQLLLGPAVLLAVLGLAALFGGTRGLTPPAALARGRAAGVAALAAVVLLVVGHGKPYYAGPVYPLLWAAGAAALLGGLRTPGVLTARRWRNPRVRFGVAAGLVALYGAATLPFGLPLLPPAAMARYAAAAGVGTETNDGARLALPQDYADMLGWPGMAGRVANAFATLTPEERLDAVVIGGNYGEAGALALYGPRLELPAAVSPAGSFWFFGPGDREGRVAVVVADSAEAAPRLAQLYAEVRAVVPAAPAELHPWLVPEERRAWVFVCRGGRRPIQEVWPELAGRN